MVDNGFLQIESMRPRCSDAEWQARVDLAACYRLVDIYGMSDMMANHISVRVPGEDGAFLINPYGMMYEEITASSLIKIDHDGNILSKPDFGDLNYGINKAGYVIHSAVHAARPEVDCVIHTHSWASMAVSSLECGLLPLTQTSMRFLKIGYHDYQGVVLDLAELAAMACQTPFVKVAPDVLEETWNNYQPSTRRPYGLMEWPALLRKLDRMDPSYKT